MHARTYHGLGTLSEALAWRWGFSFQGTQTRFFWNTAASLMNHCYHLLCSKKQSAIQIVLAFTITDGAFSTSKCRIKLYRPDDPQEGSMDTEYPVCLL